MRLMLIVKSSQHFELNWLSINHVVTGRPSGSRGRPSGSQGSRGRPRGSQGVKGYALRVLGGQGLDPQGPKGSWGRPTGSQGVKG